MTDAPSAFTTKLASLNGSAQSIETLSHWCIFHRKNARTLAGTWDERLRAAASKQKLPFLYLASDIVQKSRKKGPEWADALVGYMPDACKHAVKHGDGTTTEKVKKLLRVWGERQCFPGASTESWLDGASDGGGGSTAVAAKVAAPAATSAAPVAKKNKNDLAEVPALSGDNAALAKLLVKMENAERDVAAASERFDADVREELLDETNVENAEDPVGMLRAVQCCESAIVFKRNAVDTMTETLDTLEKKLRAALARVEAARESQSGVNMGELTQMMIKALKARKKASKRNADFIVRQIASEAGDAPLPEPVDFDADADNYDPSDAPDEYHPPDESNKRPRR